MITSEAIRERERQAYRRVRAERLARKLYRKTLDKLPLEQWREVWAQVNDAILRENGGAE